MRQLACLCLLGAMYAAQAAEPAQPAQSSTETAVAVPAGAASESAVRAVVEVSKAVPQGAKPAAATADAASAQPTVYAAPAAEGYVRKTPYDNSPYRFDMSQQGKRMSAADFDVWMKLRGLRVAGGKPVESTSAQPDAPSAPLACQPAPTQAC